MRSERATRAFDAALVVGIVVTGWIGMIVARTHPSVKSAPFSVAMAVATVVAVAPLWWRRDRPLAVLAAVIVATFVAAGIDRRGLYSVQVAVEAVVLCFAIGAWAKRMRLAAAVVAALAVAVVAAALGDHAAVGAAVANALAVIVLPAALGYAARVRRQYVAEVERRLADAERERDERAHHAVVAERSRIARELHDVVAHHVSLIGVQAGAARSGHDRSPESTRAALAGIEASSRAAVDEMRQLLDVLAPLPGDDREPHAGLHHLPSVVDRWRAAGVAIRADLVGDPAIVPPTVSSCCQRVVEEALANVSRHSGAREAAVAVHIVAGRVALDVSDPGPALPQVSDSGRPGGGRGLIGMRERVALFGGDLDVGPTSDGGFHVAAVVPWGP